MQPQFQSSGDLIADRRFEWARDSVAKGDLVAAADLLTQTLEMVPDYAAAWFVLGEVRSQSNDTAGAVAAFEQARAADPADRLGAAVHLIRLGAAAGEMPPGYVRALFDGYAAGFDTALVERLDYRAPDLLLRAVEATGRRLKFGSLLDLGCGTGLGGAAFRPFCDWMAGVDLSPGMVAQARGKGLYDRLHVADIAALLAGEAAIGTHYHLLLAADVFVYVGDLSAIVAACARVLADDGLLAFSVETHDGDGVILRETLRYAHAPRTVRAAIDAAGLSPLSLEPAATRTEKGVPVPGLIAIAGLPR